MAELETLARPYAEAVFTLARDRGELRHVITSYSIHYTKLYESAKGWYLQPKKSLMGSCSWLLVVRDMIYLLVKSSIALCRRIAGGQYGLYISLAGSWSASRRKVEIVRRNAGPR